MTYLTINEVKDHLAIARSNASHDARLPRLIDSSESWASNFLNSALSAYEDSPAQSPPSIPEDIKSAMLLSIEMEFDRDDRKMALLQKRAEELLWPYRVELGV